MSTHRSLSGEFRTVFPQSTLGVIREALARLWVAWIALALAGCWLYFTFIAASRTVETIQSNGWIELTWWGIPHIATFVVLALIAIGDVAAAIAVLVRGDTRLTFANESRYDWEDRLVFNLAIWFALAATVGFSLTAMIGVTFVRGDTAIWQVAYAFDQKDFLQWSVWHLPLLLLLCGCEALWQGVLIAARSR